MVVLDRHSRYLAIMYSPRTPTTHPPPPPPRKRIGLPNCQTMLQMGTPCGAPRLGDGLQVSDTARCAAPTLRGATPSHHLPQSTPLSNKPLQHSHHSSTCQHTPLHPTLASWTPTPA